MPTVAARDGVTLHYEVHDYTDPWKEARTLILQHGYGRSSRFWYSLIPHIARFYRVVCPDLRGLGLSSGQFDIATGISVDNYLDEVAVVADAVGAESFHYAGESLGGVLGFYVAARYAERVRTLSVMSAPLQPNKEVHETFTFGYPTRDEALRALGSRGWAEAVNSATRFPPGTDQGLLDWYAAEMGKSDVEVLIAMSRITAAADVIPLLDRIPAPILGLYPSDGRIASRDQAEFLKRSAPDARVVHLPNRYHAIWALAPAACAEAILHFMALHDGIAVHE